MASGYSQEEPSARKTHARICEGGAGQPAPLLDKPHSQIMWARTDVCGQFANNVVTFADNVVRRAGLFSANVVRRTALFAVSAPDVCGLLQVRERLTTFRCSLREQEVIRIISGPVPEQALTWNPGKTKDGIMRVTLRGLLAGVLLIGESTAIGTPSAWAQGPGSRSTLGGYGATQSNSMASMGGGSPIIPYAGNFGGFMPYRMGGGSSLSFSSRGTSAMGSARTSFSLSPMTGGMTSMSGGMGQGFGARSRSLSSFGLQGGMGLGDGMRQQMPGAGSMSVMPPSFAYPFYQPPSLLTPSSLSEGMSM